MKFKSIRLKNFMRYKGDVKIDFSIDPKKNVTVILGDNSFGKTTIAQAFRWGLYGEVATTNYTHKKDVILLNNEVIASMTMDSRGMVEVEVCVQSEDREYVFLRKQYFVRKSPNPAIYSIKPLAQSSLSMNIKSKDGIDTGWISNETGRGKEYPPGCVSDAISNMFPQKLSSYFFFDGERWNSDTNSHGKDELKKSINTILGINSLRRMMEHLCDGVPGNRMTVERQLNSRIKGGSEESASLLKQIEDLEGKIAQLDVELEEKEREKSLLQDNIDKYTNILNDGKKAEEDQKELGRLKTAIQTHTKYRDTAYAELVKIFSNIDKYMAASLLSAIEKQLASVDLEGKDIPGVTSETIDYLLQAGVCLCGETLVEGHAHYDALMALRSEVYPNKIGGPAKVYKGNLSEWRFDTEDIIERLNEKAETFEDEQMELEAAERDYKKLEDRVDGKQNMQQVRSKLNLYTQRIPKNQSKRAQIERL